MYIVLCKASVYSLFKYGYLKVKLCCFPHKTAINFSEITN